MATYNFDGVVIMKVAEVIRAQLVDHFNIQDSDLRVTRSFQPTTQYAGARAGSEKYQVYITPITPPQPVGEGFSDTFNGMNISRDFRTIRSVTYQIDCLADYQPQNQDDIEAQDLCYAVRELLMHLDAIQTLTDLGINIESSTNIRPTFSVTSEREFESTPSFDIKLSYNSSYIKQTSVIESIDGSLNKV